jgi:rsbT co-antagonist protein RsbR
LARTDSPELSTLIAKYRDELLEDWITRQVAATTLRRDLMSDATLREQCREFLAVLQRALSDEDHGAPSWQSLREFLGSISRSRASMGFSPTETATFVMSLKEPLFTRLQKESKNPETLIPPLLAASGILDQLALYTTEVYQKGRDEIIMSQQREMLDLSTPVVELWEGILALPLIGTLDSERTQVVMENLLQQIVSTGAAIAIIDITGVPTVDTLVAQHLLKTVAAARLMGADCIISGIRPQIAQTIVHLGVELGQVTTKATLASAFAVALRRSNLTVTRAAAAPANPGLPSD